MGRPFNWTLVSMAAVVLGAARMLIASEATAPSRLRAAQQDTASSRLLAQAMTPAMEDSPFAYIREDGTEIRLPAIGRAAHPLRVEDAVPRVRKHADTKTGDRGWTPVARVEPMAR